MNNNFAYYNLTKPQTSSNFVNAGWPWYNFRSSGIARFVQGGVVKTFRCTSQMQSIADIIAAVNDEVVLEVHTFPSNGTDPAASADAASLAAGHRAIADKWSPLSGSVLAFLTHHIGHDLAYSSMQLIEAAKCETLARQLVAHADDDAVWLSNHSSTIDEIVRGSYGWTPVSTWTFDLAYVAVGTENTLFICFLAED